jgi:Holliday junction resolvase
MPSPQKAKGSSWEREVAKYLTELFGETFIRAPGSGAYVGGSNAVRKQFLHQGQIRSFKGDIVPGESFAALNAECKSYKDFPFHQLFQGPVKILDQWIAQCMDAADAGDFNILFMKFNRKGRYVAVQAQPNSTPLMFTRHLNYGTLAHGHWFIMDMDLFFEINSQTVRQLCSNQSATVAA